MAQVQGQLRDPVEAKAKVQAEKSAVQEMKEAFSIDNISLDDFKPLAERTALSTHPFDGYPSRMIKVADVKGQAIMMPAYSIVALNPKEYVHQDPSGKNLSIVNTVTKKEEIKTIQTFHNRIVVDYEQGGRNIDVVFDREIILGDGKVMKNCAFVISHSARSQLLFKLTQKGDKIQVDRRYVLLDVEQASRLRRVYEMIVNPKIRKERLSKAIAGESEEDIANIPE